MKIGNEVVCVYAPAEYLNIKTQGTYVITAVHKEPNHELNIDLSNEYGIPCGTYNARRFMLKDEMIKQVLENAKNGSN